MNNIELEEIKRDVIKYFGNEELAEKVGFMEDYRLNKLKQELEEIKNKEQRSHADRIRRKQLERKIGGQIFTVDDLGLNFEVSEEEVEEEEEVEVKPVKEIKVPVLKPAKRRSPDQAEDSGTIVVKHRRISVPANRNPSIVLISDVKNWAWWLKGEYLQKYLSDEFDIDLVCLLGDDCLNQYTLPQDKWDLYFTFGYSYIDFLHGVPKFRKATGVTAHRDKRVLMPKMKQAGHLHANSMMLYRDLTDMGFERVFYIPNGVNEKLFRPIKRIPLDREKIIVGHVGKECVAKGQKEIIYPAIKKAKADRLTNIFTWKEKVPHNQMYKIYQEMDVFVVASLEDGTPNPALEAASCGRPIISNRIGNMPELITDGWNGFLVGRNIEEYVEKIEWLQNNRKHLIRMGERARATIEKYWTWEIQAENYRKMFRDIFVKEEL